MDWLGILIERITGAKLDEYQTEHILIPAGIENVTHYPNHAQQDRLATTHLRDKASGALIAIPQLYQMHLQTRDAQAYGGGGFFGPPSQYVKLLAVLLNDGTHPKTGKQILKPETVEMLMKVEVDQARTTEHPGMQTALPTAANAVKEFCMPGMEGKEKAWGFLGVMEKEGRAAPSQGALHGKTGIGTADNTIVWWAGILNTYWWLDRKNGVAGIVGSQLFPFLGESNLSFPIYQMKLTQSIRAKRARCLA